ncbi:MAG TPA: hypothetical protein VJP86_10855 [Vicinamibacterales bacterium]|nr:hypothetical protein [Vicinamibacterales bacterium]
MRWFRLTAALVILAALIATFVATTLGPPPPLVNPPGTFAFAALGDAPYYPWEDWQYPLVLRDMNDHDLAFSIHVGDIFWRPCSDDRYARSRRWFDGLKHPLVYVPGDNEWADCWTVQEGRFDPLDRLNQLRRTLYPHPGVSLGRAMPLQTQSSQAEFSEFVEHARWSYGGIVFATIHVVGSGNFTRPFSTRSDVDDRETERRLRASLAWLHETFQDARTNQAAAVVVAFHADPGFDWPSAARVPFQPLLDAFEDEAAEFVKPVLFIHGDSHKFTVDQPLISRHSGKALTNVTRLEVPGSPDVGWVRVLVSADATPSFMFSERLVPRWKYW